MRLNYKYRLFLWFVVIFATFAVGVVLFERSRERRQKTEMLELELDAYARIADAALARGGEPSVLLDSLALLLPDNLRLTCIAPDGAVVYDNSVATTENHASRPEVAAARERGAGTAIRTSATTNRAYLYYARRFGDRYIRVALPYDLTLQGILKADNYFLYFVIALFAAMLVTVNYVSGRFGRSIRQLRDFTVAARDETHE